MPVSKIFKPLPSQLKEDATKRAAQAIIDSEASARAAKTERLRAVRLAQEAAKSEAVKSEAQTQIDRMLSDKDPSGKAASKGEKAKRKDRLTEFPDSVRAKRRGLGLE